MRAAKTQILFLCSGNSCRSQMAEGWARHLKADVIEAASAGIAPHGLDPLAVRAMAEAGVDISGQRSKRVEELLDQPWDVVVTAAALHRLMSCPFPGNVRELENIIEYAFIRCKGAVIDLGHLPPDLLSSPNFRADQLSDVKRHEVETIRAILQRHPDSRPAAARALGTTRTTLWRKMKRYGLIDSENETWPETVSSTWRTPAHITSITRTARCRPACRVVWEENGQVSGLPLSR